jgi:hypothetical protein
VTTVPPLDQSLLPADVRAAPADVRDRYAAGLAFERELTAVLAKQLTKTTGDDDSSNPYASMLPDALADSIAAAGGLGLARTLSGIDAPGTA